MKTLANHIEHELQHGLWQHCTVYEDELQRLWPLQALYRERRIAAFAEKYGFRLRFYQEGLCAIFDKETAATENVSLPRKRKAEDILELEAAIRACGPVKHAQGTAKPITVCKTKSYRQIGRRLT